jgi:amino acid transporter
LTVTMGIILFSLATNLKFKKDDAFKKIWKFLFAIIMVISAIGVFSMMGSVMSSYSGDIVFGGRNINDFYNVIGNITVILFSVFMLIDTIIILVEEFKKHRSVTTAQTRS